MVTGRRRSSLAGAVALTLGLMGAVVAHAGAMEEFSLVETVTGTGTLNGDPFTDQLITVKAMGVGVPYNVLAASPSHPPDWWFNLEKVTVSGTLDSSSTFSVTVLDSEIAFDNQKHDYAGVSNGGNDLLDVTDNPNETTFTSYDLTSDLSYSGPASGQLPNSYATSDGVFSLTGTSGDVTYDATVIPVPETQTWAIMTVGLGVVGGAMRARIRFQRLRAG